MSYSLGLVIVTTLILKSIYAKQSCTIIPPITNKIAGKSNTYCEYAESAKAKPIQLLEGTEFVTKTCKTCKCSAKGLRCCEKPKPPVNVPAKCRAILVGCNYVMVSAVDYNTDCFTGRRISKRADPSEGPIKRFINSPEGGAIINLVKKGINMLSRYRFRRRRRQYPNIDPDYEPTAMDLYMYMLDNNQNSVGSNAFQTGQRTNMFGLSDLGENAGMSMFSGGSGPVDQMLLNDIMGAGVSKSGGRGSTDLSSGGEIAGIINSFGNLIGGTGSGGSSGLMSSISRLTGNAGIGGNKGLLDSAFTGTGSSNWANLANAVLGGTGLTGSAQTKDLKQGGAGSLKDSTSAGTRSKGNTGNTAPWWNWNI